MVCDRISSGRRGIEFHTLDRAIDKYRRFVLRVLPGGFHRARPERLVRVPDGMHLMRQHIGSDRLQSSFSEKELCPEHPVLE
jgi:hypothetical protein